MFFNRKRPIVRRDPRGVRALKGHGGVLQKQGRPQQAAGRPWRTIYAPYAGIAKGRAEQNDDQKRAIIKREYSQYTPGIETFEVMRRRFCIEQNAGDEKAGQREKDVNPAPSEMEQVQHRASKPQDGQAAREMIEEHQQYRDAADAVIGGYMAMCVRSDCIGGYRVGNHLISPDKPALLPAENGIQR